MSVSPLCHDVWGKALNALKPSGRAIMATARRAKLVEQLCQRLRVPNDLRDLAKLVA